MSEAAFAIAVLALIVSIISAAYARRATHASEVLANVARSQDLRARMPNLLVTLHEPVGTRETSALYYLRNNGPQDLDSIVIQRPRPVDGINYPVARLSSEFGDAAELGPLELGQAEGFLLSVGSAETLPEFRVRICCRKDLELWECNVLLEKPRFQPNAF